MSTQTTQTTQAEQFSQADEYAIENLQPGDLVKLRWTGDRRVPYRESQSWARVEEVRNGAATVFNFTSGYNRRITTEHIYKVDKKVGRNAYETVARRMSLIPNGTRLLAVPTE